MHGAGECVCTLVNFLYVHVAVMYVIEVATLAVGEVLPELILSKFFCLDGHKPSPALPL